MAKAGHPPKYKTPKELQNAINKYFLEGISEKVIITGSSNKREIQKIAIPSVCDLALFLGFAQRKSLLDYEGYSGKFCNIIKRAITKIEGWHEFNLAANSSVGSIFWLKNHGWADKHELTGNNGNPVEIKLITKNGNSLRTN